MPRPRTLLDKVWDSHLVGTLDSGEDLLYVDRHLIHEVSSPQAFTALRERGREVRRPALTLAVSDHIVATDPARRGAQVPGGEEMLVALRDNARAAGIAHLDVGDARQGIVHVVAPELGAALPGAVIVCGDSHTCTLGGLGAVAWGVGTSEVEHVLATQTIPQRRPGVIRVEIDGELAPLVTAKDLALTVVATVGVQGGTGHALEYAGSTVRALGVEGRLTLCNLSMETGARIGYVEPDEVTVAYLTERAASGARWPDGVVAAWLDLRSDAGAQYARTVRLDAGGVGPTVTWGTRPSEVVPAAGRVPSGAEDAGLEPERFAHVLDYMGLEAGQALADLDVDVVFIGSCTNARISDLRLAAEVVGERTVADGVRAVVVPGSMQVRAQAEREGLDRRFAAAGFEWRQPGCSMCVSVNGDLVGSGQRCVSTSNRNFEGRQGPGARTHLASPAVAAATAVTGRITDPRELAS